MNTQRLQMLNTLLESSPSDSFVLFAIAKEYEGGNDLPTAISYYEKLRATNPAYVGMYYHLAKLYEKTDRIEDAIATYKEGIAVALSQKDNHARAELAEALMGIDDSDG